MSYCPLTADVFFLAANRVEPRHPVDMQALNTKQWPGLILSASTTGLLLTQGALLALCHLSYASTITKRTRHTARTSTYSLTFRVATPAQYGRNGTASLQITSHTQQVRRFYRWCVRACVVRALGLADYRWALPRISIMLP